PPERGRVEAEDPEGQPEEQPLEERDDDHAVERRPDDVADELVDALGGVRLERDDPAQVVEDQSPVTEEEEEDEDDEDEIESEGGEVAQSARGQPHHPGAGPLEEVAGDRIEVDAPLLEVRLHPLPRGA